MIVKKKMSFTLGAVILSLLFTPTAGIAQETPKFTPQEWALHHFQSIKSSARLRYPTGKKILMSSIRLRYVEAFERQDFGFDGITQDDINISINELSRSKYANYMRQWHLKDKNQDLKISRKELGIHYSSQASTVYTIKNQLIHRSQKQRLAVLNKLINKDMIMDLNKDGYISAEEAIKIYVERQANKPRGIHRIRYLIPMIFDKNNDGTVTKEEYLNIIDEVIATLDEDSNGEFSIFEERTYKEKLPPITKKYHAISRAISKRTKQEARQQANKILIAQCTAPTPATTAKVILITAKDGKSISNLVIKGQKTNLSLADITISKDSPPLFLLLSNRSAMVWRFNGAIEKIKQVWASSYKLGPNKTPLTGIIGVPRQKIKFTDKNNCLSTFVSIRQMEQMKNKDFRDKNNNMYDRALYKGTLGHISLPVGSKIQELKELKSGSNLNNNKDSAALMVIATHAGKRKLISVDASTVILPSGSQLKTLQPFNLALAKLVDEGVLKVLFWYKVRNIGNMTIIGGGNIKNLSGKPILAIDHPKSFLILKPTILRTDFFKDYEFILAAGVKKPEVIGDKTVTLFSQKDQNNIKLIPNPALQK